MYSIDHTEDLTNLLDIPITDLIEIITGQQYRIAEADVVTRLHNVLLQDKAIDMPKHAPQDVVMQRPLEAAVV